MRERGGERKDKERVLADRLNNGGGGTRECTGRRKDEGWITELIHFSHNLFPFDHINVSVICGIYFSYTGFLKVMELLHN